MIVMAIMALRTSRAGRAGRAGRPAKDVITMKCKPYFQLNLDSLV